MEHIKNPKLRFRAAVFIFFMTLVCWPATHILMVVTNPPENSWVFHVLLAISWIAITFTCLDIMATTDVRKQDDDGES